MIEPQHTFGGTSLDRYVLDYEAVEDGSYEAAVAAMENVDAAPSELGPDIEPEVEVAAFETVEPDWPDDFGGDAGADIDEGLDPQGLFDVLGAVAPDLDPTLLAGRAEQLIDRIASATGLAGPELAALAISEAASELRSSARGHAPANDDLELLRLEEQVAARHDARVADAERTVAEIVTSTVGRLAPDLDPAAVFGRANAIQAAVAEATGLSGRPLVERCVAEAAHDLKAAGSSSYDEVENRLRTRVAAAGLPNLSSRPAPVAEQPPPPDTDDYDQVMELLKGTH